jgi:ABC-type Mn2+/Zn2+ transport system permease subunit
LVAPSWNRAAVVAPLVGVVSVALGLWLSYVGDFPASAVTVAVLFALFFPALLWHSLRRS